MINYDTLRAGLKAAFRKACDWQAAEHDGRIEFEDEDGASFQRPTPYINLDMGSIGAWGTDEVRAEYNETTDQMDTRVHGLRSFTVRLTAISYGACGNQGAEAILSRFRTNIRKPGILQALEAIDVALVTIPATSRAKIREGDRWLSVAVVDVLLSTHDESEPDTFTADSTDYFTRVDTVDNLTR